MPDNQIFKVSRRPYSHHCHLALLNDMPSHFLQATYSGIPVYEMYAD